MTVHATMFYEEVARGEPFDRVVLPPAINTDSALWTLGDWSLVFPAHEVLPAPDMQWAAKQVREWTTWSTRRLAEALGTSHTTVRAIESGRQLVEGHSGDLRRRLVATHSVIERVYVLANRDAVRTTAILDTTLPGQSSPVDELRSGHPNRAYLAAIDILRPRRPGLIVGDRPRRGGAPVALHE
jgi:hypothetical protein